MARRDDVQASGAVWHREQGFVARRDREGRQVRVEGRKEESSWQRHQVKRRDAEVSMTGAND